MKPSARVLIIDDDRGMCETLSDAFSLRGFTAETATSGREGLEKSRARPFDAVIADIKLPDMSGLDLLNALKTISPETEVLYITAYASVATAIQAINGAAFAYVTKPFEMEHLLATLGKALEKQRLERALRESEERYRLITEHVNDAIFLIDMEDRLVFSNRKGEELTGYRTEEFQGRPLFSLLTPEGVAEAQARLEAARAGREVLPFFETRLVRKDGTHAWVEVNLTSIVKEGKVIGRLGVARDLTERKRLEQELQRQQEALLQREKVASLGTLLAGVAHELNNPLSVIVGHTTLLQHAVEGGPLAERAKKIFDAAERCARIVRNFLALARQYPPERKEVSLNRIVREAMELLAYQLRVDNVETALDLAKDLPPLWADLTQLQQLLVNLVTNAHQAMREAPPPRRLTLRTRADAAQSRVTLEVADTGPGIPSEIRSRIFEPFFTTKPAGKGTGLGLSLCLAIVEGHGGVIRVESEAGQGALFLVELPVGAPSEVRPQRLTPEAAAPAPVRGKAILVVDDEPQVASLLAEMLALEGHKVDTAANGGVALDRLRGATYDLILSDIRMPELDGPGLYRELERGHPELARRIIFLTGDELSPETREFLERTGKPGLSKPFVLEEVRRAVQQALRAEPGGPAA